MQELLDMIGKQVCLIDERTARIEDRLDTNTPGGLTEVLKGIVNLRDDIMPRLMGRRGGW